MTQSINGRKFKKNALRLNNNKTEEPVYSLLTRPLSLSLNIYQYPITHRQQKK